MAPRLRSKGFRMTPQRAVILEVVAKVSREDRPGHPHLTAHEVYQRASARLPGLNLATVYRTLESLNEAGLIDLMSPGMREARFSLRDPDHRHGHLVCRACGRVLVFDLGAIEASVRKLKKDHGFAVDADHLTLAGLCRGCQKPQK